MDGYRNFSDPMVLSYINKSLLRYGKKKRVLNSSRSHSLFQTFTTPSIFMSLSTYIYNIYSTIIHLSPHIIYIVRIFASLLSHITNSQLYTLCLLINWPSRICIQHVLHTGTHVVLNNISSWEISANVVIALKVCGQCKFFCSSTDWRIIIIIVLTREELRRLYYLKCPTEPNPPRLIISAVIYWFVVNSREIAIIWCIE